MDEELKKLLIETPVDKLVILAKQKRGITVSEAAKLLGTSEQQVEEWTRILEEHGMLKLSFPVVGPPKIVPSVFTEESLSKKVEEFAERKTQIEMLAENYLDKSKEAEKRINLKFVPVEEELYEKLRELEDSIRFLEPLKSMEKKMEADISEFERGKDIILKESEDAERKTSDVMRKIDGVKASSQDLAADVAEALSEMKKQENTARILLDEQKKLENEIAALNKEIKIVSALTAEKREGESFTKKISDMFQQKKPKKKKLIISDIMDIKKSIGIHVK